MHDGLFNHVVGKVTGSILTTTVGYALLHQGEIFLQINIEGRYRPVALGYLGFLFHIQYFHGLIHHNDPGTLQLLDGGLFVAHNAGGLLIHGKVYKLLKREEQDIICDNVVEMNLSLNFEYLVSEAKGKRAAQKRMETVTIISSNGKGEKFSVLGDSIIVGGKAYPNARIVSASMSVTVLTEEGAAIVERMRQGKARAPKPVDFFTRYTRQFSTSVSLPQPY